MKNTEIAQDLRGAVWTDFRVFLRTLRLTADLIRVFHVKLWGCHQDRWIDHIISVDSRTVSLKSRYDVRGIESKLPRKEAKGMKMNTNISMQVECRCLSVFSVSIPN